MGAANVSLWAFPSTEMADQSTPHPDGHAPSSAAPTQVNQEAARPANPSVIPPLQRLCLSALLLPVQIFKLELVAYYQVCD